jgi:hypothetical protein
MRFISLFCQKEKAGLLLRYLAAKLAHCLILVLPLCASCDSFATLKVTDCNPSNGSYGVAEDAGVEMSFSADLNRADLESMFILSGGSGSVDGAFTWTAGNRFLFMPRHRLVTGSRYLIRIPQHLRDVQGNRMSEEFISDFCVGSDIERPRITGSSPAHVDGGIVGVPISQNISVTFSEPMDQVSTQKAFTMSPSITGYFSWNSDDTQMTFNLTSLMSYGTRYRFSLSDKATDRAGNQLEPADYVFFTTGSDFEIPQVTGICRAGYSYDYFSTTDITNVGKRWSFSVVFNKEMSHRESEYAFKMIPSARGDFSWNSFGTVMTYIPADDLPIESDFVMQIDGSAADVNGRRTGKLYQVVVRTAAEDSRYFHISRITGTVNDDSSGYDLDITPSEISWPVLIDTGPVADVGHIQSSEQDYYLRFYFEDSSGAPVSVDQYSVLDSRIYLQHFGTVFTPAIEDISFEDNDHVVLVKVKALPYRGAVSEISRITFCGGSNGIKDRNGNYMRSNFGFDCQSGE